MRRCRWKQQVVAAEVHAEPTGEEPGEQDYPLEDNNKEDEEDEEEDEDDVTFIEHFVHFHSFLLGSCFKNLCPYFQQLACLTSHN